MGLDRLGMNLPRGTEVGSLRGMRKTIVVGLSTLFVGCAGVEVRGKTDSELKTRFSEVERELATYHTGEQDPVRLRRYRDLANEERTVERELFRRCRAGDQNACLPQFNLIHE